MSIFAYPAEMISMPSDGPEPFEDEDDLIRAMREEMKFVEDPALMYRVGRLVDEHIGTNALELIKYFEEAYAATDQDTVVYAPEFVIVVRNILEGKRPVKLRFLTDFEGEEK